MSNILQIIKRQSYLHFLLFITLILFLSCMPTGFAGEGLTLYKSEQAAQQHCPNDLVVWLNTASGIWHQPDGRWYGRTKQGAFVCRNEAAMNGNRAGLR